MQPTGEALFYPKQRMIIAANAAAVSRSFHRQRRGFGDWETSARWCAARVISASWRGCIHPGQVTIVNEEYTPTAEEVEYARKVIVLDQRPLHRARLVRARRQMIDIPIIVRAQKLIRRYEAIRQRESRTLAAAGRS